MKKIVFGILVSMLMISSVLSSAAVLEMNLEKENTTSSIFVMEDGEVETIINVGDYEIESNGEEHKIIVEDFGHLLIPGNPDLPSRIYSIAIPPGAIFVEMNYEIIESETLSGSYNVQAVPAPDVIGEVNPEAQSKEVAKYEENNIAIYGNDDPYPSSNVEFVRTSGHRKYNLVDVRVIPFTYFPQSCQLIHHSKFSIILSYTFPEDIILEDIMVDNMLKAEQYSEEFIYNYEQAQDWYPNAPLSAGTYDYVIITTDSLESKIDDLVDWEEAKGRNVYVATTDWIDSEYDGWDLAEKMRNFLIDKYPSEEWGILDVCLIGDYDDVPMRRCEQSTGYGRPETDFYYAELSKPDSQSWDADGDHKYGENSDPIDMYGEVNVGRIPWSSGSTVEDICEKTVAYEQNYDESYKKNMLLIGAFFWPDTDNAVLMELKTDPDENPWMADWTRTTIYEEAQTVYECDYDISYSTVRDVWSNGEYAFVNWGGHGSPTACYEYYPSQAFVDTDTCNYLNDDYPAIVFACACSNSDTDDDNIGQMMLEQGAIGFLGATKVAYGYHGWTDPYTGAASASMDYFFTTKCTSGDYTQGQAHQWSLAEMYTHDLWYYPKYEAFEWGALWGNPDLTMGVVSQPPEKPAAPDGPDVWTIEVEAVFTASTTDPDGDHIYYMFDWGDGTTSDWEGPEQSGNEIEIGHTWAELGDYDIKVRAMDSNGVVSDWSPVHVLSIVPNSPPDKPIIEAPSMGQPFRQVEFRVDTTDPEGHQVYYHIWWGDGFDTGWEGPYASGEIVLFKNSWGTAGDYNVIVKAKDEYGATSSQENHRISIQKSRVSMPPAFLRFLELFRERFPILEQLIYKLI